MINHLGISQGFHDAGIALVDGYGNIQYASHSERYSKIKNDPTLSFEQFDEIKDQFNNLTINYYERPWLTNLRRLYAGQKMSSFQPVTDKLNSFNLSQKVKKWPHHKSHAAAAFQTSPFDRAAVVIVDAVGEWDTASIWHAYYDNGIAVYKKLWSQKYPHSIGLFYTAMTKRIGLRPMEDEYVLMGMAAYGSSTILYNKIYNDFISDTTNLKFKYNFHVGCDDWAQYSTNADIASATQTVTEELLYHLHKKAKQLTNENNVCYGGGVALNCKFNVQLSSIWDNVWICPNPGDCGSALGAAALSYSKKLKWSNAFLGYNIDNKIDIKSVIDELQTVGIVGIANGRAEWGPRALGNRSLLADPRDPTIKNKVNEIKQRHQYRPFAPAVLEEHANKYFDLKPGLDYRYMQYAVKVKSHCEKAYPAICHVDGTARVQVVPNDNSNMRNILEAWYSETSCPMLLNTSLNIRGEPIVNNKHDAYRFSRQYGVKVIS